MPRVSYSYPLVHLDASFVAKTNEGWRMVDTLAEADGVQMLCARCYRKNTGSIGTHMILCWFEGKVDDDVQPGPGRWSPIGTGLNDLTFVPGKKSCSVQIGKHMHGYVRRGAFHVDTEGDE